MKHTNVSQEESDRKISIFYQRKSSLSLMSAVKCMVRAFLGTAVKLSNLLLLGFWKKISLYMFPENFLPVWEYYIVCGKMKHWLATGSIPHHIDTVTVQLVLKVKWCCEKEGWQVTERSYCAQSSEFVKFHISGTVFNKHYLLSYWFKYLHVSEQEVVFPQGNSFCQRLSVKMQGGVLI